MLSYITIFATFATDGGLSMLSYITIFATLLHLLQTEVGMCIQIYVTIFATFATDGGLSMLSYNYICYIATFATVRGRDVHSNICNYICHIATYATNRGRSMHSYM